jgi:hypothetical protein
VRVAALPGRGAVAPWLLPPVLGGRSVVGEVRAAAVLSR